MVVWIGIFVQRNSSAHLALGLAALGLNLLTGYTGQPSLASAGFMAIGAFAAYNLNLRVPGFPMVASLILAGVIAAGFGLIFCLPGLRLKGFYLAISTLAASFLSNGRRTITSGFRTTASLASSMRRHSGLWPRCLFATSKIFCGTHRRGYFDIFRLTPGANANRLEFHCHPRQ